MVRRNPMSKQIRLSSFTCKINEQHHEPTLNECNFTLRSSNDKLDLILSYNFYSLVNFEERLWKA